ncbi:MAG: hypothetical protein NXI31_11440 [bacterium]|nr:hypothetical protein [bacterium]
MLRVDGDELVVVLGKNGAEAVRVDATKTLEQDKIVVTDGSRPFTGNVGCNAATPTDPSHLIHKAWLEAQLLVVTNYAAATFQPIAQTLSALSLVVTEADKVPYFTGAGTASKTTLSAFARTLIDDADAAAARTTLGMGTAQAIQTLAKPIYRVDVHSDANSNTNLASMAVAEAWFKSSRIATFVDLANYSEVRLIVRVSTTSSSANSPRLRVRYRNGSYTYTVGNYSDIGTSEVSVALDGSTGLQKSSWISIAEGARADDVVLAVTTIGGDGSASPGTGHVAVEFR